MCLGQLRADLGCFEGPRRQEAGGRRQEAGGRRKEEGEGGRTKEEGGGRREEGGRGMTVLQAPISSEPEQGIL